MASIPQVPRTFAVNPHFATHDWRAIANGNAPSNGDLPQKRASAVREKKRAVWEKPRRSGRCTLG